MSRLRIWEGHNVHQGEAAEISGVKTVKWLPEFWTVFHNQLCASRSGLPEASNDITGRVW